MPFRPISRAVRRTGCHLVSSTGLRCWPALLAVAIARLRLSRTPARAGLPLLLLFAEAEGGVTACRGLRMPMARLDDLVMGEVSRRVLQPDRLGEMLESMSSAPPSASSQPSSSWQNYVIATRRSTQALLACWISLKKG